MIRHAVAGDEGTFRSLVIAYLEEMAVKGSEVIPTERTVEYYMSLFWGAVNGATCLLIEYPVAFTLAVPAEFPYDTTFGRTAMGIGTYIAPAARRRGLSVALRERLLSELKGEGYETVLGMVGSRDASAEGSLAALKGVREHQRVVLYDLKDSPPETATWT